jgi:hypothetical protein
MAAELACAATALVPRSFSCLLCATALSPSSEGAGAAAARGVEVGEELRAAWDTWARLAALELERSESLAMWVGCCAAAAGVAEAAEAAAGTAGASSPACGELPARLSHAVAAAGSALASAIRLAQHSPGRHPSPAARGAAPSGPTSSCTAPRAALLAWLRLGRGLCGLAPSGCACLVPAWWLEPLRGIVTRLLGAEPTGPPCAPRGAAEPSPDGPRPAAAASLAELCRAALRAPTRRAWPPSAEQPGRSSGAQEATPPCDARSTTLPPSSLPPHVVAPCPHALLLWRAAAEELSTHVRASSQARPGAGRGVAVPAPGEKDNAQALEAMLCAPLEVMLPVSPASNVACCCLAGLPDAWASLLSLLREMAVGAAGDGGHRGLGCGMGGEVPVAVVVADALSAVAEAFSKRVRRRAAAACRTRAAAPRDAAAVGGAPNPADGRTPRGAPGCSASASSGWQLAADAGVALARTLATLPPRPDPAAPPPAFATRHTGLGGPQGTPAHT